MLLDREELGAWRGLLRVHARLTKALDADLVREHDLPLSSYEVLLFLADAPDGRLRMSELADGVLLSRSGLTRLVDRMERDGLLRRERCEDDARGYYAIITDAGRELFQRARATHLDGVRSSPVDSRLVRKAPASTMAVPASAATCTRSSLNRAPSATATTGTM